MHAVIPPDGEPAWPSPRLGWVAVLLLSLAAVASYLDRVVINLLVQPIKADFKLTDTGFAALQALAFGLFYTVMAFPIGRLADRRSRRTIILAGLAAFSVFSIASGLAKNYWQLFLARTGIGVGEASLTPPSYSIMSDYFPPARLGRPLAAFTTSAYFGIGLAFIAGGSVIGWLSTPHALDAWPAFAQKPWQVAFFLVGVPGLFLLLPIGLFLREPPRRGVVAGTSQMPLSLVCQTMFACRSALIPMFLGFAMVVLPGYAATVWTPALFIRVYGWSPARIGFWYGILYMVFGMGGAMFAGWLSDRLTARGMLDAPLKIAAYGFVGFGLFGALAPLMPSPALALAMFAPALFLATMPFPLAGTAIQLVMPNQLRAQTSAIYLTVVNLIGLGLGPILVGLFTDHLFTRPTDIRYSLAIINLLSAPAAAAFLLAAAAPYRALRAPADVVCDSG